MIILFLSIVFSCSFCTCFGFSSSPIKVYNNTDKIVYFSPYYQQEFPLFKASQKDAPVQIAPGSSIEYHRPPLKLLYSRVGIITFHEASLKNNITHHEYINLEHFALGASAGKVVIQKKNDKPYIDTFLNKATGKLKNIFNTLLAKKEQAPTKNIQIAASPVTQKMS
jgi:hypothetical protein